MYRFTLQYFFRHMSHRPCVVQGPQSIKRLLPRALPDLRLERGEVTKRSLGPRLFLQKRQDLWQLWQYAPATCRMLSCSLRCLRRGTNGQQVKLFDLAWPGKLGRKNLELKPLLHAAWGPASLRCTCFFLHLHGCTWRYLLWVRWYRISSDGAPPRPWGGTQCAAKQNISPM